MASVATVLDLDKMASGLNPPNGGSTNSVSSDAMVVKNYCFVVATFLPLQAPFARYPLLCIKSTNFWRFLLQVL
jgi:hypothetical protein